MDDRVDAVLADQPRRPAPASPQSPVTNTGLRRHRPREAGREIVEDDDVLPGIEECETMWLPI